MKSIFTIIKSSDIFRRSDNLTITVKNNFLSAHTLQLALISPEIIHMAIVGTLPPHISFKTFKAGLPADWTEQKRFLGLL